VLKSRGFRVLKSRGVRVLKSRGFRVLKSRGFRVLKGVVESHEWVPQAMAKARVGLFSSIIAIFCRSRFQ
jgi:hypothetical protein